ncbi:MAG: type II toxin-antitoxin system VapC family toxin [Candidatus Acidiferrum sp.]
MNFLLDTNVVSEWAKPQPDSGVVRWLSEQDEDRLFLSVITIAELRHGVERLAAGARRERLERWINEELMDRFEERILPVKEAVANAWGRVMAMSEARGARMNVMDGFLAASALEWGLVLVTRNVKDFEATGCELLSLWSEPR